MARPIDERKFQAAGGSTKSNARLYLPSPLVSAFVSSDVCRPPGGFDGAGNSLLPLSSGSTAAACCIG